MEAVYLHNSSEFGNQSNGNPKSFVLLSSSSRFHGGSSNSPFSLSYNSYSSSSAYHNRRDHQQNQPPLLPLPISKHYQNNSRIVNINISNRRSVSVRKSNASVVNRGREKPKYQSAILISSTTVNNQIGPDPKDVPRALFLSSSDVNGNQMTRFSGSVVSSVPSPPPSSLPLPKFSVRPKLNCNTQAAAGIDAGATDNLRQILRLR